MGNKKGQQVSLSAHSLGYETNWSTEGDGPSWFVHPSICLIRPVVDIYSSVDQSEYVALPGNCLVLLIF